MIRASAIRTIVVDDEDMARKRVVQLLDRRTGFEVVAQCDSGREAAIAIARHEPDLVFLDIQMPEMSGFDVLEAVDPDRFPILIFVTAYDEYAIDAFEVNALDYLLKPFDDQRFDLALERAIAQVRFEGAEQLRHRLERLLDQYELDAAEDSLVEISTEESRNDERIIVKSGEQTYYLKVDEIDWIEAADYYAKLHIGAETHMIRASLSRLEERLDPRRFARIHRSAIVNLDRVRRLEPWMNGAYLVFLEDGTELKLSRRRRSQFADLLGRSI